MGSCVYEIKYNKINGIVLKLIEDDIFNDLKVLEHKNKVVVIQSRNDELLNRLLGG